MDLLAELETMVTNAESYDEAAEQIDDDEVQRWQRLFEYNYAQAVQSLDDHKQDLSRKRISDEYWDAIKSEQESQGYSRDAYEHWINSGHAQQKTISDEARVSKQRAVKESTYLMLLEYPLHSPEIVRQAAGLFEPPECVQGSSDDTTASFCKISSTSKSSILAWISDQKSTFKPTFVRLSKASKDLDQHSPHPSLGIDATLPHNRIATNLSSPTPQQDDYPVWYFFYGTLADPTTLKRVFSIPDTEMPTLVPAKVSGGQVRLWAGQYKALVDGSDADEVHGSAYLVTTKGREEALQFYETERYDVVRCTIVTEDGMEYQGLTFRFVGDL